MRSVDKILSEFVEAWNAGDRPRIEDHLARLNTDAERDELSEHIDSWLLMAPTPAYSEEALAEIAAQLAFRRAAEAIADERGVLGAEVARLRGTAGISLGDLAVRVVEAFGLKATESARAEGYLADVESGEIAGTGLSRRLLDVLGDAIGATGERLASLAAIRPARPAGDAVFFRAEGAVDSVGPDLDAIADAAFTPAPQEGSEELDRLFFGGPGA